MSIYEMYIKINQLCLNSYGILNIHKLEDNICNIIMYVGENMPK